MNQENNTVEKLILQNLILNEEYARKTVPFLHGEYFHDIVEKTLFKSVQDFILEYGNRPTKEAIVISLDTQKNLTQDQFNSCVEVLNDLCDSFTEQDDEWLYEKSEKFCKDKAVYNAIMESIHIIDGKNETQTENAIPEILSEALSVSFDTHIGHDYIEDADERYEFYHKTESKIPFDLEMFNTITQGGTPNKTLNMILAGTGVGKSLFMCHHAAACLSQNNNVLYITCEMAEERIAERIDANIMDITMDDMKALPKQIYDKKLETATQGCTGKLIVKEYPTATAHANHFRALLDELKLKKKFIPDIIFIDYLNICASSRMKQTANVNSYTYIKAIAEELRGLAVERNVPIFSATQTNRSGFNNSDVGLEDTSESFGLPATADLMFALISTEELEEQNQMMIKQLKNRYNDVVANKKFVVGINRAKMKLFDVDPHEQTGLVDTNLSEDTEYGNGFGEDSFKQKFAGWNV